MEDILASIRRILSEDEAPAHAAPPAPAPETASQPAGEEVLVLDPSMMVSDPAREAEPIEPPVAAPVAAPLPPVDVASPPLVAPEAAAVAASLVGNLVRTLAAERNLQVRAGGPTIEDLVREELRPLLKAWLDEHLPPLVERLVRAEIERVVGRVVP